MDPLATSGGQDMFSPYAAMGNAPESMVDPNGTSFESPNGHKEIADLWEPASNQEKPWQDAFGGGGNGPGFSDQIWGSGFMYIMQIAADARKREAAKQQGESKTQGEGKSAGNFGNITREKYVGNVGGSSEEDPQGQTNSQTQSNLPTENKGGIMNNQTDFFAFMWDQAKNNSKEVAAYEMIDPANGNTVYFVQPWKMNGKGFSYNLFTWLPSGFTQKDIVAQYHTHPMSSGPSVDDMILSKQFEFIVHTIGADGRVWRGHDYFSAKPPNINPMIPVPMAPEPRISQYIYGTVIYQIK